MQPAGVDAGRALCHERARQLGGGSRYPYGDDAMTGLGPLHAGLDASLGSVWEPRVARFVAGLRAGMLRCLMYQADGCVLILLEPGTMKRQVAARGGWWESGGHG